MTIIIKSVTINQEKYLKVYNKNKNIFQHVRSMLNYSYDDINGLEFMINDY